MRWRRQLATKLGLDGNPLRRRIHKVAAYSTIGLLAMFAVAAPVTTGVIGHWAYRAYTSQQLHQRSWHQVRALVLNGYPAQGADYDGLGASSWVTARWTAPDGHPRVEVVPVPAYAAPGSHIQFWVDGSGQWSGPPLSREQALLRVGVATAAVPFGVAFALWCVSLLVTYLVDRRRLAAWDTDWATTGPHWTKNFRPHG